MILRDGKKTSLWQNAVDPYVPEKIIKKNVLYDVLIAGGGITGITTGLLLQEAGFNCIIVEAKNLCFGTTGGTTAHLNTLLDTTYPQMIKNFGKEKTIQVANGVKEAIALVRANIMQYEIDCSFSEANAYLFSQNEEQTKELEDILERSLEVGVEVASANSLELNIPFNKILRAVSQAKFNPVRYVYTLAKEFEKKGGQILINSRVTDVDNNDVVTITTTNGIFKAKNLIYATHIPPTVNLVHLRCAPYRSYATAFQLKKGGYPKELYYDMYDPYHYYRSQEIDGTQYMIVGGYDHKTGQEENTEKPFLELKAHCRKYFNVDQFEYEWSSQYFEPADGLPYIGHLPGQQDNIFVATGFGGNGMVYSHVAAVLLTNMLTGIGDPLIEVLNPNRIKPVAGFTNFIKHNAGVVKNFAEKLFSHEDLDELADVATGEGRLVDYEKQKMALYKDEAGMYHALSPSCTHLGCEVKWNAAECSWDCPCHGARYDVDGDVLTGPADRQLKKIEIQDTVKHS